MDTSDETAEQAPATPQSLIDGLFTEAVAGGPQPFYRRLHEQCPVSRTDFGSSPAVYLTRYEDVREALRHPEIFSSGSDAVQIGQDRPLIPLQVDPPEHAKYRRLLDPELAPRWVKALEDETRARVDELIAGFVDDGGCDFHHDFAEPLPSGVFLDLFGLPFDRRHDFYRWRDNIIRPDTFDLEEAARIRAETGQEMYAYFESVLDERTEEPDGSLFSRLMSAEVEGEKLTREEILDISYLFMLGGLDTVTATLDCAITLLARNPDKRSQLASDPSIVPSAVEELLRWETPVQVIPRIARQATTVGDVEISPGDHVVLVLGAANVDSEHFDDADAVHLERDENRHLAFGGGPHRCLGSHLARMELRIALERWHHHIPDYEIAAGAKPSFSPGIRQAASLPLRWDRD